MCLEVRFHTESDTMTLSADLGGVDGNRDNLDSCACWHSAPDTMVCHAFHYHSGDSTIRDSTYTLAITGNDGGCQPADTAAIVVNYDGAHPQIDTLIVPDTCFVYGETVVAYVIWDDSTAAHAADFSALDTQGFNNYSLRDSAGYLVFEYTIPDYASGNRRSDGCEIPAKLTATDSVGNFFTRQLDLCISNHDPVFVSSAPPDSGRSAYHDGEQIHVTSYWDQTALPDTVWGDFSLMDSGWLPRAVRSFHDGSGMFTVRYTIADTNSLGDAFYPVVLYARDADCGLTTTTITLQLDNTPPPNAPQLDPVPAYWREAVLVLSGTIVGAPWVLVELDSVAVDTVAATADSFVFQAALQPGKNHFAVHGMDEAGNKTVSAAEADVYFLGAPFLEVPHRFRPDDEFRVGLDRAAMSLTLEIRNLAGERLRRWKVAGASELFEVPWDGRNEVGETVMSGPYLAIIEVDYSGGGRERHVKPFFFSRH